MLRQGGERCKLKITNFDPLHLALVEHAHPWFASPPPNEEALVRAWLGQGHEQHEDEQLRSRAWRGVGGLLAYRRVEAARLRHVARRRICAERHDVFRSLGNAYVSWSGHAMPLGWTNRQTAARERKKWEEDEGMRQGRERREIQREKIERKRKTKRYYDISLFPATQRSYFTKRVTKTNLVSPMKVLLEPKPKKLFQPKVELYQTGPLTTLTFRTSPTKP